MLKLSSKMKYFILFFALSPVLLYAQNDKMSEYNAYNYEPITQKDLLMELFNSTMISYDHYLDAASDYRMQDRVSLGPVGWGDETEETRQATLDYEELATRKRASIFGLLTNNPRLAGHFIRLSDENITLLKEMDSIYYYTIPAGAGPSTESMMTSGLSFALARYDALFLSVVSDYLQWGRYPKKTTRIFFKYIEDKNSNFINQFKANRAPEYPCELTKIEERNNRKIKKLLADARNDEMYQQEWYREKAEASNKLFNLLVRYGQNLKKMAMLLQEESGCYSFANFVSANHSIFMLKVMTHEP
jgi:hypothetical protein